MSKTILFGPSGFLGPSILKKYPDIIAIGRNKPPSFCKNKFIKLNSLYNLNDCGYLKRNKIDYVIFLIGNSNHIALNDINIEIALDYNYEQLKIALLFFSKYKIKKFITFSGALIYDENKAKLPCNESQPIDPYKSNYITSKYLAELLVNSFSDIIPIINLRLSNIYGPSNFNRPDLILMIFNKILNNEKVMINSKKPLRDFIHIDDVAEAVISLCQSKFTGTINVGTGIATSIEKICNIIEKLTKHKIFSRNVNVLGPMNYKHDISLIKNVCGWRPKIKIEKGLEETWKELNKSRKGKSSFHLEKKKIFVTGSSGFLGNNLLSTLKKRGYKVYALNKKKLDLMSMNNIKKVFTIYKPDVVFHCAGRVGGIKFTDTNPAKIFHQNMIINANVFEACKEFGVEKLILIGASCIYSSKKSGNFSETDIFYGPLHPSVEAYGFCKLSQIVGIKAYKSQYDLNYFSVIFPNIYGPGDDFSLEDSHVIGALVKKFVDAKRLKKDIINCWGSGKEIRDGIYVGDAVESLIRVANTEMKSNFINIGSGKGFKINVLAEVIKKITKFKGKIIWEKSENYGVGRKILDVRKMKTCLGWYPKTKLSNGLKKTINWYKKNYKTNLNKVIGRKKNKITLTNQEFNKYVPSGMQKVMRKFKIPNNEVQKVILQYKKHY